VTLELIIKKLNLSYSRNWDKIIIRTQNLRTKDKINFEKENIFINRNKFPIEIQRKIVVRVIQFFKIQIN
jgi:hypothetical protein